MRSFFNAAQLSDADDSLHKFMLNRAHGHLKLLPHALLITCSALSLSVWAVVPFQVSDIRIDGLQRVESGTVFATLPFRIGETYTDEKGAAAIRALYALGLFSDVRVEVVGSTLVVNLQERAIISQIDFLGNKEFDKDSLIKAMRDIGLQDGRPFDKALADRAEQELKRQYIGRGLYAAEVIITVTPIERNRVSVSIAINEGGPARIKEVRVVGAKAFDENTLTSLFDLNSGNWLSWYTKSDLYSRAKLNGDIESLKAFYLSRGYLEFRIDSTQISISPDRRDVSIVLSVNEGSQFYISSIKLEGDFLGRNEEFQSLVKIKVGGVYQATQVNESIKSLTENYGRFGYAFPKIDINPIVDRNSNSISFNITADPGRRAYVRRINISGNTRTRDEVVRREFRQLESAWYDGDKIRLSRDRVDRLGFFRDINVDTEEVSGALDQVDLQVQVSEKPTGSLQLGAGFSSAEKLALSFSVKQENVFGSGNYLGLEVNTSKFNRTLVLNTVDPYFTKDGVSRNIDAFYRTSKPYTDLGGNYELVSAGGGLKFGVPFSEEDRVFFGAGIEQTTIKSGTNIPAAYIAYAQKYGYSSGSLPLTIGWARDGRDSAISPTNGILQRLNTEWGIGFDTRYLRGNYLYQHYFPLTQKITVAFNGELGWGKGLGGRPFPVFKNFYSGGLGSVRGFEQGTLGPRDVTGALIGGAKKITLNAEVLTPLPGSGSDKTVRLFGFFDVGNAYGESEKFKVSDLRASVGVGLSWLSPMGPLRLAYSNPVRKQASDRIQKLQFQIGTSF
jgi:outer membrane protein insertion porin family